MPVARKKKTTRKKRSSKKPNIPIKTLNAIHKCWKETSTRKECLERIVKDVPDISPPAAWGIIRKLSKTDKQWMITAKQKKREKEENAAEKERIKRERIKKREKQNIIKQWRDKKEELQSSLKNKHIEKIQETIDPEFFFCPDVRQQVNNISCIFRVFSGEEIYGFSHSGPCLRCKKMDKYIPTIEDVIGGKNE